MNSVSILGLPIQNVTMEQAVEDVYGFFAARESKIIVTPNAEILQMYTKDEAMQEALKKADYIVPDGVGILLAAKRLSKCHPFHRQKTIEYDPVPKREDPHIGGEVKK